MANIVGSIVFSARILMRYYFLLLFFRSKLTPSQVDTVFYNSHHTFPHWGGEEIAGQNQECRYKLTIREVIDTIITSRRMTM